MTSSHIQALNLSKHAFFFASSGKEEFAVGLTYTALSRARKFENLAFDPMPSVQRIKQHFKHATFTKRLDEDNRLKTIQEQTEAEANIEDVATDDSDVSDDESADMEIGE